MAEETFDGSMAAPERRGAGIPTTSTGSAAAWQGAMRRLDPLRSFVQTSVSGRHPRRIMPIDANAVSAPGPWSTKKKENDGA